MRKFIIRFSIIFLFLFSPHVPASEPLAKTEALVEAARQSVSAFTIDPEMQWFRDNMSKAKGVFIVPSLVKGGFIFGGSGGSGVFLVKGASNNWSYPAFYTMGTGTIGLQIGVEVSEIILMVMTDKGIDALLSSSFKLGGDVSIAAGPIGAGAKATTADIFAFSRSKGIYGGINIEGAVIKVREKWNSVYYNHSTTPRKILIDRSAKNSDADNLRKAVAKLAVEASK